MVAAAREEAALAMEEVCGRGFEAKARARHSILYSCHCASVGTSDDGVLLALGRAHVVTTV